MARGRKLNPDLPETAARKASRAYRERRAAQLQTLEDRVALLMEENQSLRDAQAQKDQAAAAASRPEDDAIWADFSLTLEQLDKQVSSIGVALKELKRVVDRKLVTTTVNRRATTTINRNRDTTSRGSLRDIASTVLAASNRRTPSTAAITERAAPTSVCFPCSSVSCSPPTPAILATTRPPTTVIPLSPFATDTHRSSITSFESIPNERQIPSQPLPVTSIPAASNLVSGQQRFQVDDQNLPTESDSGQANVDVDVDQSEMRIDEVRAASSETGVHYPEEADDLKMDPDACCFGLFRCDEPL